jgi:D-3-phosphoglycerate dehydrogenase
MSKSILITDSLFIYPEHEKQLLDNGYVIERLDKPQASEEELCEAIKGKHGYILGGIESVTFKVIESADTLKAISFTGSGYAEFIPAHEQATRKGIAISAAIGGNAQAVAEYTIALILSMVRRLPLLTTKEGAGFYIARGLHELTLGIVGFGHVGSRVAAIGKSLGMNVIATTRSTPRDIPKGIEFVPLSTLITASDVVSLHVNKQHGTHAIGRHELEKMKDGAILINAAFPHAVDTDTLHQELVSKRLLAAFDAPADGDFSDVPLGYYLASNSQTAFNTHECNKIISDRVTSSLINLLSTGEDADLVNPEYKKFKVQ